MIFSCLNGRLGNLLFEVAAGASHARSMGTSYSVFSGYCGKDLHQYTSNILRKINCVDKSPEGYETWECGDSFEPIPKKDNMILQGYYQSYTYIDRDYALDLFEIDTETAAYIDGKYGEILDRHPVSLHVRRGDYLSLSDHYTQCTESYYKKAINYLGKDRLFLVFSDDIVWCKEKFKGKNFLFAEQESAIVDLYLQSKCRHHIIANSTFSWWGAWLDSKPDSKVVYPSPWYGYAFSKQFNTAHLCPKEWISLSVYPHRVSANYTYLKQVMRFTIRRVVWKWEIFIKILRTFYNTKT